MSNDLSPADTKRDELRVKIEASERRIAERSVAASVGEAAQAAVDYTKANPLKVVGGAIAVGLVIGMMTSPGRRVAGAAATTAANAVGGAASGAAKGVGSAAKAQTSKLVPLIADAVAAYGIKLVEEAISGARAGQDKFEDLSDDAAAKARELHREVGYAAGTAADKGRNAARRTRRRAERAVRDLTEKVKH